MTSLWR